MSQFESVQDFFSSLESRFVPEAAKGVDITFQYDITGDGGGQWYAVVKDGALEVNEGTADSPTVTMTIAAEHYIKVVNGKMKGQMAYLTGKMKLKGNKMAAQKIQKILPTGK